MKTNSYVEMINKDRAEVLEKMDKEIEQTKKISKELHQRIKEKGENKELITYYNKAMGRAEELQKEKQRVSSKMSPDYNLGVDARRLDEADKHNHFVSQKNKAAQKIEGIQVDLADLYNHNIKLGIAQEVPLRTVITALENAKAMLTRSGAYIDVEATKASFDKRYAEVEKIKEERTKKEEEQNELRKLFEIDNDEPMDGSDSIAAYPFVSNK